MPETGDGSHCRLCGRSLLPVEISLTLKLLDKAATRYYCKRCLAEKTNLSEEELDELVLLFRRQGCTLFT